VSFAGTYPTLKEATYEKNEERRTRKQRIRPVTLSLIIDEGSTPPVHEVRQFFHTQTYS